MKRAEGKKEVREKFVERKISYSIPFEFNPLIVNLRGNDNVSCLLNLQQNLFAKKVQP